MSDAAQGALFADEPTLGVGDVVGRLTKVVASAFPSEIWVRGEVDGLRPPNANGHTYLALCERASRRGPTTTLEAVLLAGDRRRVERSLADHPSFRLANGIEVRVRGRITFRFGRVRLVVSDIDPVHTLGRLAAARDRVLRALAADGLLDANARRALAAVPLRVGVVTSAGSAACEDVLHELGASGIGFRVLLADARVQGVEAEASVLRALHHLRARRPDVVLLVRGGGARTDLAAFDSERIARAVAAYPVPVVTGVGHEIDTSVVDEVAHTTAKTPTAAAAVVVEQVRTSLGRAERAWAGVARRAPAGLATAQRRVDDAAGRVDVLTRVGLARATTRVDDAVRRLAPARVDARLRRLDASLAGAGGRLGRASAHLLADASSELDVLAARTAAVDPARALARGWSLTRTAEGRLVRRVGDVRPGDRLLTTLADGTVASTADGPAPTDGTAP